jgi:hypothetical protein
MRRGVAAVILALCVVSPAWADAGSGQPADSGAPPCVSGNAPERVGKALHGDALMPVVIGAIHPAKASAAAATVWCLESTVPMGTRRALIWRDPSQSDTTRVTVGSGGYELRAFRETLPPQLLKDAPAPAIYEVVLVQDDKLKIVGFFDAPPPIDDMLAFFANDRFAVYADIDLKTHQVSVYRPY